MRILPSKPLHICKICGKKLSARRQLEKHINAEHKVACIFKNCSKMFFKPTEKNAETYSRALEAHNAAKHSSKTK